MRRAIVGLSGGVDSSVAALLLQRAGFSVTGVFMRNWDPRDEAGATGAGAAAACEDSSASDMASARVVASCLRIPLHTVDFSGAYWTGVFEQWLAGYARGVTLNPDAACNRVVKFGAFRELALGRLGGDVVATGHYAQVLPSGGGGGGARLLAAADGAKDQSDFLATVPAGALSRVLMPLGGFSKAQVRAMARDAGLPTAARRESMGICFVGKRRSLADFLSGYLHPTPGELRLLGAPAGGAPLATARCAEALTVGQRARVPGRPEPLFVVANGLRAEAETEAAGGVAGAGAGAGAPRRSPATVWVAPGTRHPALLSTAAAVAVGDFHWVGGALPAALEAAAAAAAARSSRCGVGGSAPSPLLLAAWLRGDAGSDAGAVPSMPVFFRDKHRPCGPGGVAAEPNGPSGLGDVTVASQREFLSACSALCRGGGGGVVAGAAFQPLWRLLMGSGDGANGANEQLLLILRSPLPLRAAAPGQLLVLYSADAVEGEGVARTYAGGEWEGGGRECLGAGPLLCAGVSQWDAEHL
jgi:tRNA (5-methylaminomethyl-2-thiouridylate)-methyltransferase